jgi:hypothetical protein
LVAATRLQATGVNNTNKSSRNSQWFQDHMAPLLRPLLSHAAIARRVV